MKQWSSDNYQKKISFTNPNSKHPDAKAFHLVQVDPDIDIIAKLSIDITSEELFCIQNSSEIPKHYPTIVRQQIKSFLDQNNFDSIDSDVCVISPFIPHFRGYFVEIFDEDKARKHITDLINRGVPLHYQGLIQKDLRESKQIIHSDPNIDSQIREAKRMSEEINKYSVDKAKQLNKKIGRLW